MAIHGHPNGVALTFSGADTSPDDALADNVRTGLTQTPKRLSSRFFYDAEGSRLFQQIMQLPEYYLTRCEFEILSQSAGELLRRFCAQHQPFELIELGAGDGLKTKVLLRHFLEKGASFTYVPIDISAAALVALTGELNQQFPDLAVRPRHDDYFSALADLDAASDSRKVVLFLGSNVGNFTTTEAVSFYQNLHERLRPGDLVLTGFDLKKHPAVIQAAYNDALGVTRAFNLNLLRRINRELAANFDLSAFDHYETYDPEIGEARSYLVSQKRQQVRVGALDLVVDFEAGETLHTEISRKFARADVEALALATGFALTAWLTDCRAYFADVVFEKR